MLRSWLSTKRLLFVRARSSTVLNGVAPPFSALFLEKAFNLLPQKFLSTSQEQNQQEQGHSLTVSFLINSCGLSPDSALSASKRVNFESLERPESVIRLLKDHGFSSSQISYMIRRYPKLLLYRPDETLFPKLDFMCSKGVSRLDMASIFCVVPWIFSRSLNKHIVPAFDFFVDLLQSKEKAIATIRRNPRVLYLDLHAYFIPNIATLRAAQVSASGISYLVHNQPSVLVTNPRYFNVIVEKVKDCGIDPSIVAFVKAIMAVRTLSKESWDRKFDIFRRWGWSEDMTREAFKRCPCCITLSEHKIMATMDYFVNKFGLEASSLVSSPKVLLYSLEGRSIPRCSVIKVLESKGLLKKSYSLSTILYQTGRSFEKKFVTPYLEEVPGLLDMYMMKTTLQT